MRYRKLDSNNDYSFGNSALDFYYNVPDAVGQAVETGLLLWLGEWYLDTSQGTPWIEGVLGRQTIQTVNGQTSNQVVANGTIQNRVLSIQGVVNIQSYASQFNTEKRTMSVQMLINTIYGPTPVDLANQQYL